MSSGFGTREAREDAAGRAERRVQLDSPMFQREGEDAEAGTDAPKKLTKLGKIEVPRRRVRQRLQQHPSMGLISAIIGCCLGLSCIALYAPVVTKLQRKLPTMGPIKTAFLVASPLLSGSLLRVLFGARADAMGSYRLLNLQLICCTFGMLCVAMLMKEIMTPDEAPNGGEGYYYSLLFFGAVTGTGISTFPVGACQVSYWYPKHNQGTILGVFGGMTTIAPGLASYWLPLAFDRMGVPKAYFAWVGTLMLGTLLYYMVGTDSWYFQLLALGFSRKDSKKLAAELGQEFFPMSAEQQEELDATSSNEEGVVREETLACARGCWRESRETYSDLRRAAACWKTWALVSIYFCAFGGQVAVIEWLPLYWNELHSSHPDWAGPVTGIFTVIIALARSLSGPSNAKLGGEIAGMLFFAITAVAALFIAVSRIVALSIFGLMVLAVGLGVGCNAAFMLLPQEVPEGCVGGAAGIVSGVGCFGGFALTPLMAIFPRLLGQGGNGYAWGFLVIAMLALGNIRVCHTLLQHSSVAKDHSPAFIIAQISSSFGYGDVAAAHEETSQEDSDSDEQESDDRREHNIG